MRKHRLDRKTPLVLLLLLLAFALVLGGAYQSSNDEASAALPSVTFNPTFPTWTIQPILLASDLSPTADETEVALNRNVTVKFSLNLDESTLNASTFKIKKAGATTYLAAGRSYSSATDIAVLNPLDNLLADTVYEVTLTDGIESTDGLPLFNDQTWSFKTITPPEILTRTPVPAAADVPVDETVSVTFDKTMDWSTVGSGSFYLQEAGGDVVPVTMLKSVDKRTAMINPLVNLEEGAMYVVTLTTAVTAENGLHLKSTVVWSFCTAADAPQVTTRIPAQGATDVPVDQVVAAVFDMNMDPSTLTAATFYLHETGGTPLPALVAYDATTRTATLDPVADLEEETTYLVTLSTAVESSGGRSLTGAPVVWSFSTAAGGGGGSESPFTDVTPGVTPHAEAIIELADRGVVIGKGGGLFGPNDLISRQQFAKMIVLTLDLLVTGAEVCPFTDVSPQIGADPLYPSKYVAVCADAEITKGKTATSFDPWTTISHQQLITMITRSSGLSNPPAAFTPNFTPGQFYPEEHYLNAREAQYGGLLDGLSDVGPTYDFFAGSTRGECSQLLFNLIGLLGL